jgi:hypothetical protein
MMNLDTGLTYMQARWMDNETGRFISPDPQRQGENWYIYCENNPTTKIDPDGTWDDYSNYFWGNYYYGYNPYYYNYNWK